MFLHPAIQLDVFHRFHDLRHKQYTYFCTQHVQNLHVLVSHDWWDFTRASGNSVSKGSPTSSILVSKSSGRLDVVTSSFPDC